MTHLVANLKKREADAVASIAAASSKNLPVVFWFSSKEVNGDAFVAGKNSAPAYILKTIAAKNVVTTEEEWPLVGWETIAQANPRVIVIATMDRRRYAADDPKVKVDFLENDAVTKELDAVKNRHFIMMDAQSMNPTIRTIDGIETSGERHQVLRLGAVSRATFRPRAWWALLALTFTAFLLIGLMISLAVSIGEIAIPVVTTVRAVSNRLFGTAFELSRIHQGIVWDYRLSRALVAASAGASLALCGAILQALLRNPLAEPYVLGISAGASTGAVCVMILGFGYGVLTLSGGAFIGAVIAFVLVGILAIWSGRIGRAHYPVRRRRVAALQCLDVLHRHDVGQCRASARRIVLAPGLAKRRPLA